MICLRMTWHLTTSLLAAWALAGCGSTASAPSSIAPPVTPADRRLDEGPDRIVVRGDNAPDEAGPFTLRGRYLASFLQRAAGADFTREVPFTAHLEQRRAGGAPRRIALFERAAATGSARVTARGRWTLVIDFGDAPFEVTLRPTG